MAEKPVCTGTTQEGKPCRSTAVDGDRCRRHSGTSGTAEKRAAFLESLTENLSVFAAAKAVGVGTSTVYRWRDADPEFDRAVSAAQSDAVDELEQSLFKRAKASDTTAAIFLLKTWRPDRYADRTRVEHSGTIATPPAEDAARVASIADELEAKRQAKRAS